MIVVMIMIKDTYYLLCLLLIMLYIATELSSVELNFCAIQVI